jgi:hypothetical protein
MHLMMARDLDGPSLAIAQQAEAYVRQGVAFVPNKLNPVTEAMACYARGKVLLAQPHPTEVIHELDLAVSLATDHSTAYEMRRELAYTCLYAPSVNRRRASEENVRALEERAVGLLKNIQGKGLMQEVRRYSNNVLGTHDSWKPSVCHAEFPLEDYRTQPPHFKNSRRASCSM